MAKAKKITAASIMKALEANKDPYEIIEIGDGEDKVKVKIKKRLSLIERGELVDSIASMVWSEIDDGEYRFSPYLRKFAYDFNILSYFTDIALPGNIEAAWGFIESTNIVDVVVECVGTSYIDCIVREANELIEYNKEKEAKRSKLDSLIDSVLGVVNAIANETKNLDAKGLFDLLGKYAPDIQAELINGLRGQIAEGSDSDGVMSPTA